VQVAHEAVTPQFSRPITAAGEVQVHKGVDEVGDAFGTNTAD